MSEQVWPAPAASVNDRYSRAGYNDEISAFLPVDTELYTADQVREMLKAQRNACEADAARQAMNFDHIKEPMTLEQIKAAYDSHDYSAELLLQHLLLWVQSNVKS